MSSHLHKPLLILRWAPPALLAACVLFGWTAPAHAFRTAGDKPQFAGAGAVAWSTPEIAWRASAEPPTGVDYETYERTIGDAFDTWQRLPCGAPQAVAEGSSTMPAASGDGVVTVQAVFEGWTQRGFAEDAAARTIVEYTRNASGAVWISDADVYVNAEFFTWSVGSPPLEGTRDLRRVLRHELGHVLGLEHPCEESAQDGAPSCAVSPGTEAALMYPLYGDVTAPSTDDAQGLCFLYGACMADACPRPPIPPRVGAGLPNGDPCTAGSQCASAVCGPSGACARACNTGADCDPGSTCSAGTCVFASGGEFGAACRRGTECASRLCLLEQPTVGLCSRRCNADCPAGFDCTMVASTPVCRAPRRGGGCAAGGSPPGFAWAGVLVLAGWIGTRRRRR